MGIIKIGNKVYDTKDKHDIELILEKICDTTNFGRIENQMEDLGSRIDVAKNKLNELNVKISKLEKRVEKKK